MTFIILIQSLKVVLLICWYTDVPQTPLNFTGYSYTIGDVNLTWVSGFNGGPEQFFILSAMEGPAWKVIGNVSDPGEGRLVHFDPGFFTPGQEYSFRIYSCNRINCSLLSADTRVTVKGKPWKIKPYKIIFR